MTVDELAEAVLIDIEYTSQTLSNLAELSALTAGREPNVHEMAAFGAYVRDAYTGLENILVRFSKFRQVALPDSADWHLALVSMFRDPPHAGLPILLPDSLIDQIQDYRGFRHVFNKRYTAHLDWEKLKPLVENAPATFNAFHERTKAVLRQFGSTVLE